jgi:hypothetical protein
MTATYENAMTWLEEPRRVRWLFLFTCVYGVVRAEAQTGWPIVRALFAL